MLIRRSALQLVLLAAIVSLLYSTPRAQSFELDLNDYRDLQSDLPWDTLRAPIDRLQIGLSRTVPIFLPSDFARDRVIEEYLPYAGIRVTFRVSPDVPFQSEEVREGVFIRMTERPIDSTGVALSLKTIDDIATERYSETIRQEWAASTKRAINAQDAIIEEKKGLLNISIPVALPGAVEKLIGQGEKTNIDISGRESITFAGESRRVSPFYGVEGLQKQSLFPSLDMKQELDVRLQGRIGEKINLQVDHTSSTSLESQNRIRLNYTGFDDDVVKLIELGNTSLSLPGSGLVSFAASRKGLFGIKTFAQAGPVDLTVIASKEEGEVSRASFSPQGGQIGQMEERSISDRNFIVNTYFFLDRPPDRQYPDRFIRPKEGSIDVYQSVPDYQSATRPTTWGAAYVDSLGRGAGIGVGADFEKRQFELLTAIDDYRFVLDAETEGVIGIELVRAISRGEVLAVAYVNEVGDTIGDFSKAASKDENAPLRLELIWPADPLPQGRFGYTWAYMMRNIYNLGLSNIDGSTLGLEIEQIGQQLNPTTPDSSSVPWIRIFGLDQTDESGTGKPDNRVDLLTGVINLQNGILTFPSLTPFDPDPTSVQNWTEGEFAFTGRYEDLVNPALYTKLSTDPDVQSLFNIVVKAASTTRTFRIDAFNITEGSEVVTVDGQTLERNRDYKIDYETGEVELIGDVQLTPSSNITIDYEFKPLAGGMSSTLLGFNSTWSLSKSSRIGTTWLYESKASATVRPRLGEEPTRAVIGGFDANLQYEPQFLTSLVNLLPLVDTDATSTFGVNGGVAFSFPDPNTQGEAYIDDMEGVEDSDVFSLIRRSWYPASPPVDPDVPTTTLAADTRANVFWYNIEPDRGVHRRDLNPDLDERESTLVPSLDIEFDTIPEDSSMWGGVMTGFRGGIDLSQSQFIEFWVNDFRPDTSERKGTLHIDLGYIDEDFYNPDVFPPKYNTEDANFDGFTIGGTNNEDTGLDGILTGQTGDDAGDDYVSQRIASDGNRFSRINGTEANGLLDSEDLDGSTQLETSNAYFTFTVDLSDSAVTDIRRDFPSFADFSDELDSWRFYRVELSDFAEIKKDGLPVIEQIKHARIWLSDIGETVSPRRRRLQIADFKVVGNRWERDGIRSLADSFIVLPDTLGPRFAIGVISNKTNPAAYHPPVRPNVQNEISEKEQSLLVKYDDIEPGTGFRVLKRFAGTGQDLSTTYTDLNFFVHTDKLDSDLEYFFRLGFDSLSYYEVNVPLTSEFFGGDYWAGVSIALNELTSLKLLPADSVVTGIALDINDPDVKYEVRMVGSPSLFNVRFLFAGLRNKTDRTVSGELWIDDIYLGNRRRAVDSAQRFTGSVNMGNIINLSGSWMRTGSEYVPFGQTKGSATDTRSISLNAKTNVEHFAPLFGFSLPITGSYSRSTNAPKYMPNSDTEVVGKALQDSMKSENVTRGFSTTITRTGSKNPLLVYTFDKLKANYSMSQAMQRTPSATDTTTTMNGTLDYSITFGARHSVRLFKSFGLRFLPNSFNYRISATRSEGRRYRAVGGRFVRDPLIWNAGLINSGSITYVPLPSLTSSFRMQTERDLDLPHEWLGVDIGQEVNRNHAFQASYKPPPIWLIRAFSPDFNYSTGYREDSSPNVRKTDDPYGVRNVSANRDVSVKLGFNLGGYLGRMFGAVGLVGKEAEKGPEDQRSRAGPETKNEEMPPPDDGVVGAGREGEGGRAVGAKREGAGGPTETDSTAAPSAPAKRKADPLTVVRKLADVLSGIRKINASLQQGKQSSYSRIPGSPSLAYQLGLTTGSGVVYRGVEYEDPERIQETQRISMDSGVQLTRNIDVAGRFGRSRGTTTFRESETQTSTATWPDLSVSWKGLEAFGPFRGLFNSASATMTYNKSTQETGKSGVVQTHRENTNLTPSLVFQWKNTMQSAVGVQYGKELNDTRGSVTENSNLSVSLDLKYSFTPGKALRVPLPFLKNRTLKSRLDTSLNTAYARTGGRRSADAPGRFVSVPGTTSIKFSPRVAYNFSTALNGSFFIDFSRTHSDASDQTTTIVRVGLTATFTF